MQGARGYMSSVGLHSQAVGLPLHCRSTPLHPQNSPRPSLPTPNPQAIVVVQPKNESKYIELEMELYGFRGLDLVHTEDCEMHGSKLQTWVQDEAGKEGLGQLIRAIWVAPIGVYGRKLGGGGGGREVRMDIGRTCQESSSQHLCSRPSTHRAPRTVPWFFLPTVGIRFGMPAIVSRAWRSCSQTWQASPPIPRSSSAPLCCMLAPTLLCALRPSPNIPQAVAR